MNSLREVVLARGGADGTPRPVDRLVLGYLAVVACIAVLGWERVTKPFELVIALAAGVAIWAASALLVRRFPGSALAQYLWLLYPLSLTIFLYKAIERYVLVFHGRFLDAEVNAVEAAVFGGHPNLFFDSIANPVLTEVMMFGYSLLYPLMVLPAVVLLFRGERDQAERFIFRIMLASTATYIGFVLFPVLGPMHTVPQFATGGLDGYLFTDMIQTMMVGDPLGSAFPSGHVGMAWTVLLALRHFGYRRAFRVLLPFVCLLTVSIAYNRFHYVSDAFGGLAVAFAVSALCARWEARADQRTTFLPDEPVAVGGAVAERH
ncbi:phosphatase PAP2 family protein [Allokutzneria sp. A3M-2-11 16]|uniref:phosphatase PAP2 family protein n=1 Tax=Allokutzneria sp. A3M-2-11 16 TaxID=2962043 RepID=UPI0020B7AA8F|nr:phosphatase PAP2 family protein [Allokutzneria sp. A3M-2-11 16]MCP3804632.1 phosphatase PAP2 family protein [Allokutzneria sp. A3M-2-11 16]